jgi:hypothetical protein
VSQEPAAGVPAEDTAVVEWGGKEERPSRGTLLLRAFTQARRDRRLVPVIAGLGAIAIFASFVSEWQLTVLSADSEVFGPRQVGTSIPAGIGELGGWGAGYLIGVFVLAACTGLVLFGRLSVRDHARIVGLTAAGVLVAVLAATVSYLDDESLLLRPAILYGQTELQLEYGRGPTMAFLGVGALGVALFLAGRLMPARPAVAPDAIGAQEPAPAEEPDWPWRRRAPRPEPELESDLPPPADLTVAPTAPFVPLPDQKAED